MFAPAALRLKCQGNEPRGGVSKIAPFVHLSAFLASHGYACGRNGEATFVAVAGGCDHNVAVDWQVTHDAAAVDVRHCVATTWWEFSCYLLRVGAQARIPADRLPNLGYHVVAPGHLSSAAQETVVGQGVQGNPALCASSLGRAEARGTVGAQRHQKAETGCNAEVSVMERGARADGAGTDPRRCAGGKPPYPRRRCYWHRPSTRRRTV